MGGLSFWHLMIVLVVILIIFGAGKLPKVMGDLAQGVKNFKKGMAEDGDKPADAKPIEAQAQPSAPTAAANANAAQAPRKDGTTG
ncbi:MAG: twin-arginine translocase TatA/TatE family subunit [Alphaproteobacteria bacterium]|nr:twin-arginine translocase TatA/TatE family subunit [Alphaproteobacteria bacterium]